MTQKEFMEWISTFSHNNEDGPFCPFPLGGYCDNPLSEECAHCVFCPESPSYNA
jgi:hypothetical protein